MVMRARVVLQDLAADFVGEYRPFLRIDGSGTFDGKVQIVVRLDSTSDFASKNVGPEIDTVGDESFELWTSGRSTGSASHSASSCRQTTLPEPTSSSRFGLPEMPEPANSI